MPRPYKGAGLGPGMPGPRRWGTNHTVADLVRNGQ